MFFLFFFSYKVEGFWFLDVVAILGSLLFELLVR